MTYTPLQSVNFTNSLHSVLQDAYQFDTYIYTGKSRAQVSALLSWYVQVTRSTFDKQALNLRSEGKFLHSSIYHVQHSNLSLHFQLRLESVVEVQHVLQSTDVACTAQLMDRNTVQVMSVLDQLKGDARTGIRLRS